MISIWENCSVLIHGIPNITLSIRFSLIWANVLIIMSRNSRLDTLANINIYDDTEWFITVISIIYEFEISHSLYQLTDFLYSYWLPPPSKYVALIDSYHNPYKLPIPSGWNIWDYICFYRFVIRGHSYKLQSDITIFIIVIMVSLIHIFGKIFMFATFIKLRLHCKICFIVVKHVQAKIKSEVLNNSIQNVKKITCKCIPVPGIVYYWNSFLEEKSWRKKGILLITKTFVLIYLILLHLS